MKKSKEPFVRVLKYKDRPLSWLAKKLDVEPSTVHRWAYEGVLVSNNYRNDICKLLEVPEDVLFQSNIQHN